MRLFLLKYHWRLIPSVLFLAICCALITWDCGDPPTSTPAPYTGDLHITAMDTAAIDSVAIEIDNQPYGTHENPCLVKGLVIGVHRLFVSNPGASGTATTVEVFRDRRTDVLLSLLSEGPYLGQAAPEFVAQTITNDSVSLQRMKGKVVLLVFFEHT